MNEEKTVVMEWYYTTPCGKCGQDIRIGRDMSRGKKKFSGPGHQRAKCASCGNEDSYPATAIDNKPFSSG